MTIARRSSGSSDPDGFPLGEPPVLPRLREYRVTPYSRRLERQQALVRVAIYALCFVLGVAAGLGAAQVLRPQAALAEDPVVTVRTLR